MESKKANMDDDTDKDEVEKSFIGRYMARQIRLSKFLEILILSLIL